MSKKMLISGPLTISQGLSAHRLCVILLTLLDYFLLSFENAEHDLHPLLLGTCTALKLFNTNTNGLMVTLPWKL